MAAASRRKRTKAGAPARRRKPALGNDPFERGAAARAPVRAVPEATSPTGGAADADAGERAERSDDATPAEAVAAAEATPPLASAPEARVHEELPSPPVAAPETTGGETGAGRERAAPRRAPPAPGGAGRLLEVERRLDATLDSLEARLHDLASRAGVADARLELREALPRLLPALKARLGAAVDLVRLLEPPERLDRYGRDERFAERLEPLVELLYSTWWRVGVRDVARVPASGPAVVVANHAGAVPWDAFVLRHALRREHPGRRDLRPLLDDRECALPVIGAAAIRYGAVRASAEAAERILASGDLVGVFPEGSAVERKHWRDRYRLQRFGRGGFVKVALRTGAPIVPCAIVGSEEASPGIARTGWLAERLRVPLLAANPSLRVGAAALLPLPSRWTLRFGDPIEVRSYGPAAAEDAAAVIELTERVRATLQVMLDEGVAARTSVFL